MMDIKPPISAEDETFCMVLSPKQELEQDLKSDGTWGDCPFINHCTEQSH